MSTFPMIAPDGSTADVPEASLKSALAAGAKHAVHMQAPDGSRAYVPIDAMSAAIQRGAVRVDQLPDIAARAAGAQTPTAALAFDARKIQLPSPPPVHPLATANLRLSELALPAIRTAASIPIGIGTMMRDPTAAAIEMGPTMAENITAQPTPVSKAGAAAGTLIGLDVPSIQAAAEKAGKTGEYTPLAGESLAGLGQGVLMARGATRAGASSAEASRMPFEQLPRETITKLRQVANPDTTDLEFDTKFMKEAPEVLAHAQQANGRLPQTAHEFGQAFLDSAKTNRDLYYNQMLKPIEHDPISIPNGYQGSKLTPGTASVRQLDARLTDINGTLNPKYMRGGIGSQQAQAALGAGEARALKAEGAAIRSTLYPYIGAKTGLTAEQVARTRDAFGAQRHIGETIMMSENERFLKTAGKEMTPRNITFNPLSNTKEFVLDKALNAIRSSESPADRAVRQAMAQVRAGGMQTPTPQAQTPPQAPPPRTPAWQNPPVSGGSGAASAPAPKVRPPVAPPTADEMVEGLRFRISDLQSKMRNATPDERAEIETEVARTKEMIEQQSPRAAQSNPALNKFRREGEEPPLSEANQQKLKPLPPVWKYATPEKVMLAMKEGTLSQIEGNRLLQKLRGKSHAVTRPIPPPP